MVCPGRYCLSLEPHSGTFMRVDQTGSRYPLLFTLSFGSDHRPRLAFPLRSMEHHVADMTLELLTGHNRRANSRDRQRRSESSTPSWTLSNSASSHSGPTGNTTEDPFPTVSMSFNGGDDRTLFHHGYGQQNTDSGLAPGPGSDDGRTDIRTSFDSAPSAVSLGHSHGSAHISLHRVPETETLRRLTAMPIRRTWKCRPDKEEVDLSEDSGVEAIMVYERGKVQRGPQQCPRCRRGQGVSPECVKISDIRDGTCSNCLAARALSLARARARARAGAGMGGPGGAAAASASTNPSQHHRSYSPEKQHLLSQSAAMSPSVPQEDLVAVWNVIVGVLSRQPRDLDYCACFTDDDDDEDDETLTPARRIEDAALLVARSADEWGHLIEEQEDREGHAPSTASASSSSSSRRAWRTESEKAKLMRQAVRIRETALRIATCARTWREKQKPT
ncbi:hypothetical protein SODALDRAFT_221468 [Sodiomyces alkalinus F11]|uniref:Uncharacterized protein n=1 Tax=Sodiomyces alkalinus (strain CBS 110278 / VKM F-3762 / F11) TaxID=1314773 RepID=A0A3N2PPU4_SODAK|nr:hypothetical protein SODALDRAFT_221468 [Sodiomyces alkalinus F11]ROT36532.1 hypothetical protein SODALDRAFT_221468 [Sodiomyces alkalinus F11]